MINKIRKIVFIPFILKDYFIFRKKAKELNLKYKFKLREMKPILGEKVSTTSFDKHYTYHPAWAARCLKEINPDEHIDISSKLYFSTMVSAFIPVKFYDYRPVQIYLDNLETGKADLTSLPFDSDSIISLSCMHTIEHIGLGRYGDPIDPEGDLKAIKELKRVLAKDGSLLFVVPIGG